LRDFALRDNSNRAPDTSKVKEKMVYASSKEALRRALVGIAYEMQGTDLSEVSIESGK
jgi:cofilin